MSATALEVAVASFDLTAWCERAGFKAQGYRREEWLSDCPFCGAADKLSVNSARRKWRCFVCHHRFRLPDLVAAFEGSYHQAIQIILTGSALREGTLEFIPELEATHAQLAHRPEGWEPDTLEPPPYFAYLTDHVAYTRERGFDLELLKTAGVGICSGGRYQDRLVFPVRRYPDGEWLYFQTRATWEKHQQHVGDYRKNLNPVALDVERHATPSDVMMGLDWVQAMGITEVVLVEGPTDWLGVGAGAVVSFGTKLSDHQIGLMVRAGVRRVVMAWDPDSWEPRVSHGGLTIRDGPALDVAKRLAVVFDVAVVDYAPGTDPGAFTPAENRTKIENARPWERANRLAFIS